MKQTVLRIEKNVPLARDVMEMTLYGDNSAVTRPGQFVNIKLQGFFLRRPISVCDLAGDRLTLVYKIVGAGTAQMSEMLTGEVLDVLSGLGNGFDTAQCGRTPLLVGGGVGLPPLYLLCKRLVSEGKKPSVIMGFGSKEDVFYEREFSELAAHVTVTTADGSRGVRGFVTDALESHDFDSVCACGPEAMLKALYDATDCPGQYSFEERMGCGFGACMGCSCRTKYGYKRICREGPVLQREEIIW